MIFDNSPLSPDQFLAEYWQKKPLLLRQALPNFIPDLDANDIAGLACDELAEARLITGEYPEHNWQLKYGPFAEEDFRVLPQDHWTLLVQDVEKHYPPLQTLLDQFAFLPSWRIDDLMVSVAGPGGSVGPHVDQYDVFLLQADGTRRWEIAELFNGALLPDCELNVLREFVPQQEWLLQPGDLLYLPPGVAHHGVAQGPCMTWSIGMRAPGKADLYQSLGEWLASGEGGDNRYRDPILQPDPYPGQVEASAIQGFRELLFSEAMDLQQFSSFLGSFLSRYRLAHEPAGPDKRVDAASIERSLNAGQILRHNPWTRLLWIESYSDASLFAAGSEYRCSVEFAATLCDRKRLASIKAGLPAAENELLCALLNQGHLYFEPL
ncbi:MAG: cupin domain-containing protein [Xanthomonadales bacterium]|nr:cupin domain-containing protein [Xanthomonadales bacterium]